MAICEECGGVQKFADAKWLEEIERIYDQYETYSLTGPLDQIVLDPPTNTVRPRCEILVEKLTAIADFPAHGSWLDYGCGRGAMLKSVSALESQWELHGFDLDDQHIDYLETIDGFVAHDGTEGLSRCHLERVSVGAETRNQHRIVHLSARR